MISRSFECYRLTLLPAAVLLTFYKVFFYNDFEIDYWVWHFFHYSGYADKR